MEKEVQSVTCQTIKGEITILPRHGALLTLLAEGVIRVKSDQATEYFSAGSGYVETDGKVVQMRNWYWKLKIRLKNYWPNKKMLQIGAELGGCFSEPLLI